MVDVQDGAVACDVDVTVRGERIVAVIFHRAAWPGSRQLRDLKGAYVVPGFLDMHADHLNSADPTGSLELMLANGITGVRQTSDSPDLLRRRREGRLHPVADAPPTPGSSPRRGRRAYIVRRVGEIG